MSNSVDAKDVKDARHLQTHQSSYTELPSVQIDSSLQDSARLDFTNMFHWCPAQSLASCLLVSCCYLVYTTALYLPKIPPSNDE